MTRTRAGSSSPHPRGTPSFEVPSASGGEKSSELSTGWRWRPPDGDTTGQLNGLTPSPRPAHQSQLRILPLEGRIWFPCPEAHWGAWPVCQGPWGAWGGKCWWGRLEAGRRVEPAVCSPVPTDRGKGERVLHWRLLSHPGALGPRHKMVMFYLNREASIRIALFPYSTGVFTPSGPSSLPAPLQFQGRCSFCRIY